jgi:hypothetical protein
MLRKFLEEEAELGSDQEENDDVRKAINHDDEEENEDGLDKDLEGFVVHEGDEEEIGEENEEMMLKYQRDMEEQDRLDIQRTMQAILMGNNKKRKRGDVDGLDYDDNTKRKMRLIEERMR